MQVKLEKTVPVAAPAEVAWQVLQDIPQVAACLPGAEVTEQVDASHYKGRLKVKLGPATVEFKGEIEVKEIDAAAHRLQLLGKGSDVKGTSTASMDLTASLRDRGDGSCELTGVSEVTMTGKLVSFGGRMMNQVADQVIGRFAANFAAKVAEHASREAPAAAETPPEQAPAARPLNALSLLWSVLVGWVKSLFTGKSSKSTS